MLCSLRARKASLSEIEKASQAFRLLSGSRFVKVSLRSHSKIPRRRVPLPVDVGGLEGLIRCQVQLEVDEGGGQVEDNGGGRVVGEPEPAAHLQVEAPQTAQLRKTRQPAV